MIEEIKAKYENMTEGQQKIADYLIDNKEEAAFFDLSRLAYEMDMDDTAILDFVSVLGYEGYNSFQQDFAAEINKRNEAPRVVNTEEYRENRANILKDVMIADAKNIAESIHMIDSRIFDMAVSLIEKARKVYIVGIRSCAPLASYLGYYLGLIRDGVEVVTTTDITELYEQLSWMNQKDVLIGISFPRYSLRTMRAMAFANQRRATLISITDNEYSPINMYSACHLCTKSDMITVADSLVAPMSLINALTVALFIRNEEKVTEHLTELDQLWDDYQTYDSDTLPGGKK